MFLRLVMCLVVLWTLPGFVAAQGDAASEQRESRYAPPAGGPSLPTIVKDVREVMLVFAVTGKGGKYVRNLTQEDFRLLDNGRPPESVAYFHNQTDLPLQVGLLIDVSDSVQDKLEFEQKAAITFLERMLRPRKDAAFVLGFNTKLLLEQDFTDDPRLLGDGVMRLRVGGNTALYDAVHDAIERLGATRTSSARRAIVLISDGVDTISRRSNLDDCIREALRRGVVVYALSTDPRGVSSGNAVLQYLATSTGGRLLRASSEKDLPRAFESVEEELRSQYALAYRPADLESDGSYRKIELRALRKGLRVHTRAGYYAPKPRP